MLETEYPITESPEETPDGNQLFLTEHSADLQALLQKNEGAEGGRVLWDSRDKLHKHEEVELATLSYVDQVMEEIKGKDIEISPFADEEALSWAKITLTLVQRRRYEQGRKPWDKDQMKIWINEIVNTAFLSRNREPRKDGSKYWVTHLVGSVINAICDSRITSLSSLVALLRHDDFEDLAIHKPEAKKELLMCDKYYYDELVGKDKGTIFPEHKLQVYKLVRALTNLKRGNEADFVAFIRSILDVGIRVAILRNNERSQNLDTVNAHGDPEKITSVCHESMNIHARMASSILKMDDVEEHILRACFEAVNPQALERFMQIQAERMKRYMGSDIDYSHLMLVLAPLRTLNPFITYMAIRPLPFTKYLDKSKITQQYPFVKIDDHDPMFEVVVLTKGSDADASTVMLKTRCDVIQSLCQSYGQTASWGEMEVLERVPNVNPDCGDVVKIFNRSLGGKVNVRINTERREALRPRGVISDMNNKGPEDKDQEMPLSMEKSLKAAVNRYKGNPSGFFKHLESIFADPIVVRSRDDDPIELPGASNGMDFAAAIHPEVLRKFRGIKVSDNTLSDSRFRTPFDKLRDLQRVEVITDPDAEVPAGYEYTMDLSWSSFAGQRTVDAMKAIYRRLAPEAAYQQGADYVKELSQLFGFSSRDQFIRTMLQLEGKDNILIELHKVEYALKRKKRLLKQGDPEVDEELVRSRGDFIADICKLTELRTEKADKVDQLKRDFTMSVGRCKTDPVELMSGAVELDEPVVLEIDMSNTTGSLDALTGLIKEYGLNISYIHSTKVEKMAKIRLSLDVRDKDRHGAAEVLKCIMRLSIENKVRVRSDHFRSLARAVSHNKNGRAKPSEPQQS